MNRLGESYAHHDPPVAFRSATGPDLSTGGIEACVRLSPDETIIVMLREPTENETYLGYGEDDMFWLERAGEAVQLALDLAPQTF